MSLHAIAPSLPDRIAGLAADGGGALVDETAEQRLARGRARRLLLGWVRGALSRSERDRQSLAWLHDCLNAVADPGGSARSFDLAFGMAPRRLGRVPLALSEEARAAFARAANAVIGGWNPSCWRLDEACRVLLLTAVDETLLPVRLASTLRHADLGEQLALYRSLPLLPPHPGVSECARRGLRGNMRAVFETIAHDNPWPARHLDESAWNQMVLKALFIDSTLAPIQGLDTRANAELALMLVDYAHERRAAGRPIATELWRALGPFATLDTLAPFLPGAATRPGADVDGAGHGPWPTEPAIGALTLAAFASRDEALRALVAERSPYAADVRAGRLDWSDFCSPEDGGVTRPSHPRRTNATP